MHARFGAALAALALLLALLGPATGGVAARGLAGASGAAIVTAVEECDIKACYTVAIALTGNGSGRVQSTNAQFVPDGVIDCPMVRGIVDTTLCSHKYVDESDAGGVVVYIQATPDPGSELCDENGCTTEVRQRSRLFKASGVFTESLNLLVVDLDVARAGDGTGTVTSDPDYINCGDSCSVSLEYGEELVLTARAAAGSRFSKWTGACAGQNATCEITLTANMATTVTFAKLSAATDEPTEEPSAEATAPPTATTSPAPTDALPTLAPSPSAAPTPAPTLDPGPTNSSGASGPIVIFLAILLVGLLGGLGFVLSRSRRGVAPPPS